MAAGIAVVASRVGVNPHIVTHGENSICVDTTDEWVAALSRLISGVGLRQRLGWAGRPRVVGHYTIAAVAPRFAAALRAVAGRTA